MPRTLSYPVRSEEDCGNPVCPHLFERLSWHRVTEQTIDHELAFHLHRQKSARIGAARPDGIDQLAAGKDHGLAGDEVSRSDGQRDAQLLKSLHFEDPVQESGHAVIGAQSKPGYGVAGEVFEADDGGDLFEFLGRYATTIGGPDYGSDASSGDKIGDYSR